MSERTHSDAGPGLAPATNASPLRRRIVPLFAGTSLVAIGGVVLFQVLRPEPAASQTREPRQTAQAPQQQPGQPSAAPTSTAVASVNGQTISYEALARECVNRHGKEVLENLINKTVIQQSCDQRRIQVSQAEIQQEVIAIAKKFNLPPDTWYQMLQAERGLTPEQYQQDIIWPMLALKKLAGSEVAPTEDDMLKAFEREYGPRVRARMILFEGNVRNVNQIWEEATANPDNFEQLARKHSADPNTRPLGGVIPPIRKNGGNPTVEDQAFKLKAGEISPVIEVATNRYVILKCEGRTEQIVEDPKQVWKELYNLVVEEKTQQAVAKIFEQVKDEARIINYFSNEATPVGQARTGQKVQPVSGSRPAGANTVFPAGGK